MEAILGVKIRWPNMEAILGVKMTQHGSYLVRQNDPTWRLSWGSKWPNMEAILKVRRTQHGGYLGAPRAPAWLEPKNFEDLQLCLNRKQCCSFLLFTRPPARDFRPQLGPKPKNLEDLQWLLPQEAMLQLPLCLQRRPLQDPFCIHKLHPHSLVW